MNDTLGKVTRARIPQSALGRLAAVRDVPGVTVSILGDEAWVEWAPGESRVLQRVMPIDGCALYWRDEGGLWFELGARLPTAVAVSPDTPIASAVVPAKVEPGGTPATPVVPILMKLARSGRERRTSALRTTLDALQSWAKTAPTSAIARVRGARAGASVVLLGDRLPAIAGERFWGERVLLPIGFAADPAVPEAVLAAAIGISRDEIAIVEGSGGVTVLARGAIRELSRAAIRAPSSEARP